MSTMVITGATAGIGFETARQLLDDANHLIVHARNERKAARLVESLSKVNRDAAVTPVWGDLSDMQAVSNLADQINSLDLTIDCVINNAGIYSSDYRLTADGLELTMAVNYFAPYLLTRRIIGAPGSSKRSRIVNVSSMTHSGARLDLNDLAMANSWSAYDAYANSKFANILFSNALAARNPREKLVSNALHPGVVTTKLLREAFSMSGISTQDGARTSVYLATHPDIEFVSGKYFDDCKQTPADPRTNEQRLINELWDKTQSILEDFID
ncbi:MAG: SDR family NAD(P)-dependent oxidoreductase [Gammaproteobacteria bacterium]